LARRAAASSSLGQGSRLGAVADRNAARGEQALGSLHGVAQGAVRLVHLDRLAEREPSLGRRRTRELVGVQGGGERAVSGVERGRLEIEAGLEAEDGEGVAQIENDSLQPQALEAFGFVNLKPCHFSVFSHSSVEPAR